MTSHNFVTVGYDTDGLAFRKPDHSVYTPEERASLLVELNSLFPKLIKFEDDGLFPCQLNIKTKNYCLVDDNGKTKIKGSALKATTKEKALQEFVRNVIKLLVDGNEHLVHAMYLEYAKQIVNLKDISQWCSKKTITSAVLKNTRTNERRVREALKGKPVQEGDKVYMFYKTPTELALLENFDGTYDVSTLLGKLHDTLCVFETVLDLKDIPNLALKKHKGIVEGLKNETK
jgi:hypothetical protein